ncbi:MAG TPA: DUF5690 family protein [Cyclobacteriaceae bacterium]|jgi:hypothetical protein|nr:DUF5690 family protein [Cyclobacteriaceae bacterium]
MSKALSLLEDKIKTWLTNSNGFWFSLYATCAAFSLYTCVYAFRKTFSVATFDGLMYAGISYKVWLVIAQVVGYGLSKFIGIKFISELQANSRSKGILVMVSVAGVSWLLFALVPPPFNIIFLFTNGLPLGLVWGMVFGYLEGRKMTEILGAGLSISFIFSAGLCKSVGGFIMRYWGTSEFWMPFVAACLFILPLLFFLWLLNRIPPPNDEDIKLRTKREPMNADERKTFFKTFWPGIILFVLAYMLLTTFRDFRDNFSAEVWKTLGYGNSPEIFTTTEIPVSIAVLIIMGSLMIIKNNKIALMVNHIIIMAGMIIIGISTFMFTHNMINAPTWMISIGLGLYLGYVPFNSIFFDRLIASFQYVGTVGFIMYVADSFGYLASISVLFFKEFGYAKLSWLNFLISTGYILSISGTLLTFGSMVYFIVKHRRWAVKKVVQEKDELVEVTL